MKPNVVLTLTHKEAQWLRGLMQNPIHEAETEQDRSMRALIFSALPYPISVKVFSPDYNVPY